MPSDPAFLLALGAYARDVLIVIGNDGEVRRPEGQPRVFGFDDDAPFAGRNLAELVHPDDLAAVLVQMERVGAGTTTDDVVVTRLRQADGTWRPIEVRMFDARTVPSIEGVVLRLTRVEDAPQAPPLLLGMESLAEALSAGVLAANRAGHVVYANRAACELLGRSIEQLTASPWHLGIHPADLEDVHAAAAAALSTRDRRHADVSFRLVTDEGETRWVHARLSPLGDDGAVPAGWISVIDDITHQRTTEADLAHRATHDPLTGLPNRLLLHDRLEQAIARLHRADEHVAVMFLDLDDFKSVNDTFGHGIGDLALVDLAARIQRAIRPGDTAARVGGDEFVIIADEVDEATALAIAERVAAAVATRVPTATVPVTVHASIGVSLAGPGSEVDEVLSLADQAMYRAKRQRNGAVALASEPARK